jgi:hypothetical protein
MQERPDHVVTMPLHSGRGQQRRRHGCARSFDSGAAPVGPVAGGTELGIDRGTALERAPLVDSEPPHVPPAERQGRRRLQEPPPDLLHAARRIDGLRRLNHVAQICRFEQAQRQHGLDGDVGVRVFRQCPIVFPERRITRFV